MDVNARLEDPNDAKSLPMEIKCDHSDNGCHFLDPFVGISCNYKAASCDCVDEVGSGVQTGRFVGSLAWLGTATIFTDG